MPGSSTKGGRTPTVTDDALLEVFRSTSDPVLSTAEVADAVPIKRRGTLNRLQNLEERGELESKQIGGRNTVWWLARDEDVAEGARERAVTPSEDTPDRSDPSPEPSGETPALVVEDAKLTAVVEDVAGEKFGDTGAQLQDRKDAALAVLEYARDHGTVSKQRAIEEIEPEHPVEGQNPRTWYRKNIRPVLNEAAEYDKSARAYRLTLGD